MPILTRVGEVEKLGLGVGIDKLLAVVWFAFDPSIGEVVVGQLKLLPQKYRSSVQALVQP